MSSISICMLHLDMLATLFYCSNLGLIGQCCVLTIDCCFREELAREQGGEQN